VAFADLDAYLAALRLNNAADWQMGATAVPAPRLANFSLNFVPSIGAIPTTSVALNKTDPRAINGAIPNAGSGRLSILGARINPSGVGGVAVVVVDILNISGGLDATLTTAQTTNLPTAPLTRYTDGDGVHAALVVHSIIGTGGTTATVSYTNQAGTPGRTSTGVVIGGTGFREVGTMIRLPVQAGDTGFRSIESVTLAGSTATIGNFGVMLYRPLAAFFANNVEGANIMDCISTGRMVGQMNEVLDDACLSVFGTAAASSQAVSGFILLGEA
jgi:hypothetical protein